MIFLIKRLMKVKIKNLTTLSPTSDDVVSKNGCCKMFSPSHNVMQPHPYPPPPPSSVYRRFYSRELITFPKFTLSTSMPRLLRFYRELVSFVCVLSGQHLFQPFPPLVPVWYSQFSCSHAESLTYCEFRVS